GDHRGAAGRVLDADRVDEVTRRRLRLGLRTQFRLRQRGARGGDFLLLDCADLLQDVAHVPLRNCWVKRTNSSSLARAAPLSMISRARMMPAPMVSTRLAVYSATPALKITISRAGPAWLSSTPSSTARDSAASSTRRLRLPAMARPKSSGWISYSVTTLSLSSPTR